jgi:hypothetical protein
MSAAWGSTKDMDGLARQWRMWRMWTYVSVGSIFYLLFLKH